MKYKLILFIFFIIINIHLTFSQPIQTNIWYFGAHAGLKFVSGNPVALSNGQINNVEGCSVICDNYGDLLFYTDGITVWNKNHSPMPNGNGLSGNTSSTQTLIVRKPGNCMQFYIFYHSGQVDLTLYYSIVDMTLNGGLGDVIMSSKNTFIYYPATEKITSVVHQNGFDVWVLFHEYNTNKFMAYLVTSTGINPPVNTNIGPVHNNMIGYMKASHKGNKLATAISFNPDIRVELYDFNNTTGVISNPVLFNNWSGAYGLEFSPNDSILYASSFWGTNYLYQIDLTNNSFQTISSSVTGNYDYGALQLGPNGKIYLARGSKNYISVINNPNVLGTGCNYSNIGVTLAPGTLSMSGLPSFHQGLFDYHANDFTYSQVNCSTFNFLPSPNGSYDSLSWNFGNTLSGTNNYSNLFNPQHSFSDTGNYIVSLIIFYNKCYFDTIQHIITTTSVISLNLGNDTSICSGNQISFDAGTGYSSYLWNTGNTSSSINATNSGMYSVTVTNSSGCTGIDSINLYIQNPSVNLGNDFVLCYGQPLTLDAGSGFSSYLWQDGSTNQAYSVGASGTYWVAAINASGCIGSDTINVSFVTHPIVSFGPDTCVETGIILDAGSGTNYIYTWSTGATTQTINVVNSGNYYVEVQSGSVSSCFDKDTIYVKVIPTPVVNIGDTTICIQRSVQLFATQSNESPEFTYLWNPGGDTTSSITYSPNGNIGPNIITVLKTGCSSVIDTIIVTGKLCEITIPNVITPNNDGYNDYFVIKGLEDYPNTLLQIFNRWGKKVYESSNYQNNWNGENYNDGVYFYVITFVDYLNPITGTITIINKLN